MTATEAHCTVCDFEAGELTCAPHRAALFALTFAVVMFAAAYFLGVAVFHPGVAFMVATSVTTTATVGVAAWRIARSYRLDLFGTECRVTINGHVGRIAWEDVIGTRPRRSVIGRGRRLILEHGVVLRSNSKTVTRPGVTIFDADLRRATSPVRAHLEHILASHYNLSSVSHLGKASGLHRRGG